MTATGGAERGLDVKQFDGRPGEELEFMKFSKEIQWKHVPCGHVGGINLMMRAKTCPGCKKEIFVRDLKTIGGKSLRG